MNAKWKKWIGKALSGYAGWQHKHWILSLLLVRLLAVWFSFVVTYAGESLHFIKVLDGGKKQFTAFGIICTLLLIAFVTFGEMSLKYDREKDHKKYERGAAFMLRNLRDATSSLCDSKYNTLVSAIDNIKKTSGADVPEIVSNPEKQLDGLANQITSCLCQLLQEDKGEKWRIEDIFVSIAYEYPSDAPGEWHWATKERGLSLQELFKEDTESRISTMLYCLRNKGNKVFYNSKQVALQEKHYMPDLVDEYDTDGNLLGSIACFEDTIKKNDVVYIHYVLTISTYDKKFVSIDASNYENQEEADFAYHEAEDAVKYNMYKNVVSDFMMRARVEFCLLYLSRLRESTFKQELAVNSNAVQNI